MSSMEAQCVCGKLYLADSRYCDNCGNRRGCHLLTTMLNGSFGVAKRSDNMSSIGSTSSRITTSSGSSSTRSSSGNSSRQASVATGSRECARTPRGTSEGLLDRTLVGEPAVAIGDLYAGRYEIRSKLGRGAWSTVWLCEDRIKGGQVALKVHKPDATLAQGLMEEVGLQGIVRDRVAVHEVDVRGRGWFRELIPAHFVPVVRLLDHFEHHSPHGPQICFALELGGPSLLAVAKMHEGRAIPLPLVRKISSHTLFGLDYLHRICKLIHGDLKPENVVTAWPSGVPRNRWGLDRTDIQFKIADFGLVCRADTNNPHLIQTREYRAPEVIRGCRYGTSADIWGMGCMMYELATGRLLFELDEPESDDGRGSSRHLALIREISGGIGTSFIRKGSLLAEMLREEPTQRWSALQLLRHPFLREGPEFLRKRDASCLQSVRAAVQRLCMGGA